MILFFFKLHKIVFTHETHCFREREMSLTCIVNRRCQNSLQTLPINRSLITLQNLQWRNEGMGNCSLCAGLGVPCYTGADGAPGAEGAPGKAIKNRRRDAVVAPLRHRWKAPIKWGKYTSISQKKALFNSSLSLSFSGKFHNIIYLFELLLFNDQSSHSLQVPSFQEAESALIHTYTHTHSHTQTHHTYTHKHIHIHVLTHARTPIFMHSCITHVALIRGRPFKNLPTFVSPFLAYQTHVIAPLSLMSAYWLCLLVRNSPIIWRHIPFWFTVALLHLFRPLLWAPWQIPIRRTATRQSSQCRPSPRAPSITLALIMWSTLPSSGEPSLIFISLTSYIQVYKKKSYACIKCQKF